MPPPASPSPSFAPARIVPRKCFYSPPALEASADVAGRRGLGAGNVGGGALSRVCIQTLLVKMDCFAPEGAGHYTSEWCFILS